MLNFSEKKKDIEIDLKNVARDGHAETSRQATGDATNTYTAE